MIPTGKRVDAIFYLHLFGKNQVVLLQKWKTEDSIMLMTNWFSLFVFREPRRSPTYDAYPRSRRYAMYDIGLPGRCFSG